MSLRVIGYTPAGRRIVIDEGPSAAHLLTRGGSLVTALPSPKPRDYHPDGDHDPRRTALRAARHTPEGMEEER